MNRVKSWDSNVELANESSNPLQVVNKHLVPSLCLDPPSCPQANLKCMTMLACPWHCETFYIGQFEFFCHGRILVSHMITSPSMNWNIENPGLCPVVGTH